MFPKPPRPEPPRKAVAMQGVQPRVPGAVKPPTIGVPPPAPPAPPPAPPDGAPAGQGRGIQPI